MSEVKLLTPEKDGTSWRDRRNGTWKLLRWGLRDAATVSCPECGNVSALRPDEFRINVDGWLDRRVECPCCGWNHCRVQLIGWAGRGVLTLRERISVKMIASCECMTKPPDPDAHAADCLYRILTECLAGLREDVK